MAKMRSYCAWPAKIIKIKGKRTDVFFFGTNQTGTVDTDKISHFAHSHQEIRRILTRKNASFVRAVKEVELLLGIPENLSIFNYNCLN